MAKELLLEIGTEEIPAEFMPKVQVDMDAMIRKELAAARIAHGAVKVMATPRRLVLIVSEVAEKQEDQLIEKIGPAKRVSFDEQGNPTKAALGFAKGQGVDFSEIEILSTDKGEYICARKTVLGVETKTILAEMLPRFILGIPFKKSMRWKDLSIRFARPIHWIVALFGIEVIPFRLENIASGKKTCGHRFMSPGFFMVKDAHDFLRHLKENYVIIDPQERRKIIVQEAERAARKVGGKPVFLEELLEEVTYLVEYPTAVCGTFDREFLNLPKDVLITTMVEHQKYFPVVDEGGNLLPHFVTINNTLAHKPEVVARGNQKVIRARLSDARFFFQEDQKVSLDDHLKKLKKVVFHSQLGTSEDKVARFRQLAGWLADKINPALRADVERAATLAKADLETQMVYEFPSLQGIMGREYALIGCEKATVATAIYEHYLPTAAGGKLPATDIGAIVSIADKTDTIAGFFGINQPPTGTADPFALRRQALGILNILLDKQYPVALPELVNESLGILADKLKKTREEVLTDILEFFKGRFENMLISQDHPYDLVDAVLSQGISNVVVCLEKVRAMEAFRKHPDFEPLMIAFKRVCNIIKNIDVAGAIDPAVFETDAEKGLYEAYLGIRDKTMALVEKRDFGAALAEIARLRGPVDAFFESVMVMAEDENVRRNRLSLLEAISKLFYGIADISKVSTESVK